MRRRKQKQLNVGIRTVERTAIYAKAVNTVVANAGIKRQLLLLGHIKAAIKDVVELANKYSPEIQAKVITRVTSNQETDIRKAMRKVQQEENRTLREAEEKKRFAAEQARKREI